MERFQEGYLEQIIEESLKAFQKGTLGKFPKKFTDEVWKQSMQDFHQESKKKFFSREWPENYGKFSQGVLDDFF